MGQSGFRGDSAPDRFATGSHYAGETPAAGPWSRGNRSSTSRQRRGPSSGPWG
jgi:hypothetical protein